MARQMRAHIHDGPEPRAPMQHGSRLPSVAFLMESRRRRTALGVLIIDVTATMEDQESSRLASVNPNSWLFHELIIDPAKLPSRLGEMEPLIDKVLENNVTLRQQISHLTILQWVVGIDGTQPGVQFFLHLRFD